MSSFELSPIDGRKSFYRKALVKQKGNISELYSYDTLVCTYDHEENKISILNIQSQTTRRHINAFLDYYGFDTMKKAEMEKIMHNK